MAEKEERIMIVADEPYYCNSCKKINNCSKDCKGYIEWFNRPDPIRHFYSKSDAIERMTVAMCKFDCTDNERACENCNEWEKYDKCESLAEAALNALLMEGE